MNRDLYHERLNQFPKQITDLYGDDPIIHSVLEAYAHGGIITKEEALYRMVVELSRTTDSYKKDLIRQVQLAGIAAFPVVNPGPYQPPT